MALLTVLLPYPGRSQVRLVTTPLPLLEKAAQQDSNDAGAHYTLALGYWGENRLDEAERSLREAILVEPQYAPAYLALAYLPYGRRPSLWREQTSGRLTDSLRQVLRESFRLRGLAFQLDPLVDLRIVGALTEGFRSTSSSRAYRNALRAFGEGEYGVAYMLLDSLRRNWIRHVNVPLEELIWLHGLAALQISANVPAIDDFQNLLRRLENQENRDPTMAFLANDFRYLLALAKARSGQPADAIDLYKRILTIDLSFYMAHLQMARLYQGFGMLEQAVTEAQRAADLVPENSSVQTELGRLLVEIGRPKEAAGVFEAGLLANPRDFRASYELGRALDKAGEPEKAREAFERFLTLVPSLYKAWIEEAQARLAR